MTAKDNALETTKSVCPECLRTVDATLFERDGKVFMGKTCPEHGHFTAVIWEDIDSYRSWTAQEHHAEPSFDAVLPEGDCPTSCGLCKRHEGDTCTAIFHITNRCNLHCPTCFAAAGSRKGSDDLSLEQIEQMFAACTRKTCVPTVQLSGGEPTLRDDLPAVVAMGKRMGIKHIQVNTNGIRLAEDVAFVRELAAAQTDLAYLQFDGVDDEIYRTIRGKNLLKKKIQAIENCRKAGIGVLLVVTVQPGVNEGALGDIVRFAKEHMPTVKGIHFQPLVHSGRFCEEAAITTPRVLIDLEQQTNGEIPRHAIVPRRKASALCSFSATFLLGDDRKLRPLTNGSDQHEVSQEDHDGFVAEAVEYADRFWRSGKQDVAKRDAAKDAAQCCCDSAGGNASIAQTLRDRTLSISGMHFQDAWTLDVKRLQGCCVHVVTPQGLSIPFCTYYLTSTSGERMYGPQGLNPAFSQ